MGISLIEVVVVVGILGFIGTGVIMALDTNARAGRTLDEQVTATNLAAAQLEVIKQLPYAAAYPGAGYNIDIPSGYSVDIDIDYSDNGTAWFDTYTDETLQRIVVTVSREGGKPVLSICTYKTEK